MYPHKHRVYAVPRLDNLTALGHALSLSSYYFAFFVALLSPYVGCSRLGRKQRRTRCGRICAQIASIKTVYKWAPDQKSRNRARVLVVLILKAEYSELAQLMVLRSLDYYHTINCLCREYCCATVVDDSCRFPEVSVPHVRALLKNSSHILN